MELPLFVIPIGRSRCSLGHDPFHRQARQRNCMGDLCGLLTGDHALHVQMVKIGEIFRNRSADEKRLAPFSHLWMFHWNRLSDASILRYVWNGHVLPAQSVYRSSRFRSSFRP